MPWTMQDQLKIQIKQIIDTFIKSFAKDNSTTTQVVSNAS